MKGGSPLNGEARRLRLAASGDGSAPDARLSQKILSRESKKLSGRAVRRAAMTKQAERARCSRFSPFGFFPDRSPFDVFQPRSVMYYGRWEGRGIKTERERERGSVIAAKLLARV